MKTICHLCILSLLLCKVAFASQIPVGQDIGSTIKDYSDSKKRAKITEEIKSEKLTPDPITEDEIEQLLNDKEAQSVNDNTSPVNLTPAKHN